MKIEKTAQTTTAGVLWTAVGSLGVIGTILDEAALRFWSLTIALVACMLTCHLLMECAVRNERLRVEYLVQGLIASASERDRDEVAQRRR